MRIIENKGFTAIESDVVAVDIPIDLGSIDAVKANCFVGVQFFIDSAGSVTATPDPGGFITITIQTYNSAPLFEHVPVGVIATDSIKTLSWSANTARVKADPTNIVNANFYKIIVTCNEASSSNSTSLAESSQNKLPLTSYGELSTAQLSPIFQGSFEYTVDNTELNENVVTNGGTITEADSMAVLSTSTTANSTACLRSRRLIKHHSGFGTLARFTTLFSIPVDGTEQFAGLMDDNGISQSFKNGLAVGFNGLTFGFNRFVNDTLITRSQVDWLDPLDGSGRSGNTLIHENLNVWFIRFHDIAGAIELFFELPNGNIILVDLIEYAGKFTIPSLFNPSFHFIHWINNGTTTSDIVLKSASYGAFVEGDVFPTQAHQPAFPSGLQAVTDVTTAVTILTIRCKELYFGKENFIEVLIRGIVVSIEANNANNLADVAVVANATISNPVFTDINATNSVVEIDTSGVATGGKLLITLPLAGKNDKIIVPANDARSLLLHGDTISIIGTSANSATMKASLIWRELF